MRVVELTMQEFSDFAANHPLRNYCQTTTYAKLMGEKGFNYDYIGYKDDSNNLVAASLILNKKMMAIYKFAYAPKGVLIDYYNTELTGMFFKDLAEYYKKRDCAFLKINPEIIIGQLIPKNGYMPAYNQNVNIIDVLKDLGFKRRREIKPLDFIMPRINPYINLKTYKFEDLSDETKEKVKASEKKGLFIETATNKDIATLYNVVKNETYENINYYRNILNTFNEDAELFLLKVDYEEYLISARKEYEKELENNNYYNELIQNNNTEENLNAKMQSDRDLLILKDEIVSATEGLRKNKFKYIGGALIIKYKNRVSIILNGYDKSLKDLYPNYFIYNYIINKYKDDYDFLDMNGAASDFNPDSIYNDFNKEKLAFNPTLYEFIGEFDLVLNDFAFKRLQAKNLLAKEFYPSVKFEEQ